MDKKTKKEIFFEKTLQLISQKGFKATTMRDIAQNMDFEVANIYNYVDSKEDILENYIFETLNEFSDYLENIRESTFSPVEKLKLVMSRHVHYTVREPYKTSLFVYEWRNLTEPKLYEFIDRRTSYMNNVTDIIEEGIRLGQLRSMDSKFTTLMIFSSMRWLFSLTEENEKINPFEIEKQLYEFIFDGIAKNSSE